MICLTAVSTFLKINFLLDLEFNLKKSINPKLKLIDCSLGGDSAKEAFAQKSLPTAKFLDVTQFKGKIFFTWWYGIKKRLINDIEKTGKFPNTFPSKQTVIETMQNLNIRPTDFVVLYTQNVSKLIGATRAYVILSTYGFNAKVLEGGLKKFEDEGYPVSKGEEYDGPKSRIAPTKLKEPLGHLTMACEITGFMSDATKMQCKPKSVH